MLNYQRVYPKGLFRKPSIVVRTERRNLKCCCSLVALPKWSCGSTGTTVHCLTICLLLGTPSSPCWHVSKLSPQHALVFCCSTVNLLNHLILGYWTTGPLFLCVGKHSFIHLMILRWRQPQQWSDAPNFSPRKMVGSHGGVLDRGPLGGPGASDR